MAFRIGLARISIALMGCAAFGQQSPARFEVASVKKAASDAPPGDIPRNMATSPGNFSMRNVPLRYCLEWAYDLKDFEIAGPDWIKGDERYDIFAKSPGPATDDQMKPMLQNLLLERFQMKIHRETRTMEAYVLLAGKGQANVKEAAAEGEPRLAPGKNGRVEFHKFGISRLAFLLTRRMDHPVIDLTGLKGIYDYSVDLSGLSEFSGPASPDPNGVSIFSAIQQDLGLKLEARKQQPIEMLVIDTVNKVPIEN
jgi:uncharacterized protein (TIGR03435 family)